jgi:hypothetical protein
MSRCKYSAMASWLLLLALVLLQGVEFLHAVRVLPVEDPDVTSNAKGTRASVIIIGAGMSGQG